MGRWVVLMVLVCWLGGCCRVDRAVDRATFAAVAPEYLAYVRGDEGLSEEQRERRERTVVLWGMRVGVEGDE
jgi:hypothetical protein